MVILRLGGITDPSLVAFDGLYLFPPRAQVIASNTEVFPWLLLPPIIVRPVSEGFNLTALTLLTFSISNLLIFICSICSTSHNHHIHLLSPHVGLQNLSSY